MTSANRDSASDLSAVDVDKVEYSPMKTHQVDQENNVYIESESESESESEGSEDYKGLQDIPEENPEWDVDSYDGREWESDPELRAYLDDDDAYMLYRARRTKALENRGFLPDPWNHIYPIRDLGAPGFRNMTYREYFTSIVSSCLKKFNEEKGTIVELVNIVRGNYGGQASWKLYITFTAREYPSGPLVEYQAKAMDFCGRYRPLCPIFCRPAPKPTI